MIPRPKQVKCSPERYLSWKHEVSSLSVSQIDFAKWYKHVLLRCIQAKLLRRRNAIKEFFFSGANHAFVSSPNTIRILTTLMKWRAGSKVLEIFWSPFLTSYGDVEKRCGIYTSGDYELIYRIPLVYFFYFFYVIWILKYSIGIWCLMKITNRNILWMPNERLWKAFGRQS